MAGYEKNGTAREEVERREDRDGKEVGERKWWLAGKKVGRDGRRKEGRD